MVETNVKKLLVTASSYEHIQKFHMPYLEEYHKRGWCIHVAGAFMPPEVEYTEKAFNLLFNKHRGMKENLKTVSELKKLILKEKYDLVITHTTLGAFITRLAVLQLRHRPKLIYMCHGYLFSDDMPRHKNMLLRSAERMTARVTDLLLTMNRYDYEAAVEHKYSKRIEPVPGVGVDFKSLDRWIPGDRERLRKEYGIKEEDTVLIFPAEFSGRKSQSTLIEAMAYLPENVVLVLPGVGKMFETCKEIAAGIDRRIIFPGYIYEMPAWYSMSDIAVTSSRSEGLPFNVMEAMYMGLPVVASAVKGHVDMIEDGVSGLLYPYGNAAECAAKIRMLIDDMAFRAKLAGEAKRGLQEYDLHTVKPKVMELYDSVLK